MSYDVDFLIDTGAGKMVEIGWRNHTSNTSRMWAKALELPERPWMRDGVRVIGRRLGDGGTFVDVPMNERGVALLNNAPASEAAGVLAAAVERMKANPQDYRPMEPGNGWGSYESALEFLEWMATMAAEHPNSVISVSH